MWQLQELVPSHSAQVFPKLPVPIVATSGRMEGTAPSGASVVLSVNGIAKSAVVATNENWMVSGLTVVKGDSISVTAQIVKNIWKYP